MRQIDIPRQDIDQGVMTLTAIIGRNRGQMAAVAVMPENLPLVGTFVSEAVTEAENELRRHLDASTDISLSEGDTAVSLSVTGLLRYDPATDGQIKSSLLQYIVHYCVSRWVSTIEAARDLAEAYTDSAAGYVSKLQSLVTQRTPYAIAPDEYANRQADTCAANPDDAAERASQYAVRRPDLQPIRRCWPDGVMLSEDEAIPTDKNYNILVTRNYED